MRRPWQLKKKNSLIYMEILLFKYECPISDNKENHMFAPAFGRPLQKCIFLGISLINMEILIHEK